MIFLKRLFRWKDPQVDPGWEALQHSKLLWQNLPDLTPYLWYGKRNGAASRFQSHPAIIEAKERIRVAINHSSDSHIDTVYARINKAIAFQELGLLHRAINEFGLARSAYLKSLEILEDAMAYILDQYSPDAISRQQMGTDDYLPTGNAWGDKSLREVSHWFDSRLFPQEHYRIVLSAYRETIFRLAELEHTLGRYELAREGYKESLQIDKLLGHDDLIGEKYTMGLLDAVDRIQNHTSDHYGSCDMTLVNAGTFYMGSASGDSDETPVHPVKITRSFSMGTYPVTVGEFRRFIQATAYVTVAERTYGAYIWNGCDWQLKIDANWQNPIYEQTDQHPVTCVSWYDAIEFCNWLSSQDGRQACYMIDKTKIDPNNQESTVDDLKWIVTCDFNANGYRLPTEAEWEYAARGGNKSEGYIFSGSNNAMDVAWFINYEAVYGRMIRSDFYHLLNNGTPKEVGQKTPNEIGLYDMSGNVREWCWDWYGNDYYASTPSTDPTGPYSGSFRVNRGGSWQTNMVDNLRCTARNYGGPAHCFTNFGFRIMTSC